MLLFLRVIKQSMFLATLLKPLCVLFFGNRWKTVFLYDFRTSKHLINNRTLDNEGDFLAIFLVHEIPGKVWIILVVVIKIFEQKIKFCLTSVPYRSKLLRKKPKMKAHYIQFFLRKPKPIITWYQIIL
jgi:hypothetical protein